MSTSPDQAFPVDDDLPLADDEAIESDPALSVEDFHPEDPDVEAIIDEERDNRPGF